MRLLLLMEHLCPWSRPLALSLKFLGNEIHVVDFKENEEKGFVNSKNQNLLREFEEFKSKVDSVTLLSSSTNGKLKYILGVPKLRRVIRQTQPDIVVAFFGGGYARMAYLSLFRPYVAYLVGSDVLLASPLFKRVNQRVFNAAAHLFVNGEYLFQKAKLQAPTAKYTPLLIGIDPDIFEVKPVPKSPVQIICTRGFSQIYNNEMIIESIARLPEDIPPFKMIFVSSGPDLEACKTLADRLLSPALRSQVEFWGGVSYDKLVQGLKESHIYISMSRSDGTSTSLLEALACGLFPLLSDIPQNREWVSKELNNGRLVPLDDYELGAAALAESIVNVDHCISMRLPNRALVVQKGHAINNRKKMQHILQAIMNTTVESKTNAL